MKSTLLIFLLSVSFHAYSQFAYEPSDEFPFGRPNPMAPEKISDYEDLIGICDCESISRKQDQSWADTVKMTWKFKYIMNGMTVQDETLKEDSTYSGSIRQYNVDSASWYVHYYSSGGSPANLPSWKGGLQEDGTILLYNRQKAPNGIDGYFRITFSNISDKGFDWLGEWVNIDETFSYQTWKIFCKKQE